MPDFVLQYVYQLSDFDTTGANIAPPNESGAQAAGTPPFQLQLNAGASPQQVTVTDPDDVFGEIANTGQVLTNAVTFDGVVYPAGTSIILNYVITTDSGFEGYSISFDQTNNGGNVTNAFITNTPLVPGEITIFTSEGNVGNGSRPYTQFACFVNGTLIETKNGRVRVEDLRQGQLIATVDRDYVPLKLVLRRRLSQDDLNTSPNLRPIRILQGALGDGLPIRDLLVSPQHRMMVTSPIAKRMFGEARVLVAATKLTDIPGIYVDQTATELEYFHLILDKHEVIFAEGAPTESFYCGENAVEGLSNLQRVELFQLFPDLMDSDRNPLSVLPIPPGKRQRKLASRHSKNDKPLICR